MCRNRHRHAFVQAELTAILCVLALAASLLAVAGSHSRAKARTAGSVSNLQKFASGMSSFAADNEDKILSFSWRAGPSRADRTGYFYPAASSDLQAAANQAVAIIRWHADRRDITAIASWVPHVSFGHLPLIEYLDHRLPADFTVSPHDIMRLGWQRAVRTAPPNDAGQAFFSLIERPAGNSNNEKRWPYSSSYEFVPASYAPDARQLLPGGTTVPTVAQDPMGHRFYQVGTAQTPFGQRRVSEIVHPDKKVIAFEAFPGSSGGSDRTFYAFGQARTPMLFGDGSVSVRSVQHANRGFFPNTPFSSAPTRINYIPELSWEPPTQNGAASQLVDGMIRWGRSGLRGRDFDGPEVPWVD